MTNGSGPVHEEEKKVERKETRRPPKKGGVKTAPAAKPRAK